MNNMNNMCMERNPINCLLGYLKELFAKAAITLCDLSPDSFVMMLRYCANLKAIRY